MKYVLAIALVFALGTGSAVAQTVTVIGRDAPLNLDGGQFLEYQLQQARTVTSFHYDAANQYLVYQIWSLYYHRCGVPTEIVEEWRQNGAPDRYFDRRIKGRYECRGEDAPTT